MPNSKKSSKVPSTSSASDCKEASSSTPAKVSKNKNDVAKKTSKQKRKLEQPPNHLAGIVPEELALEVETESNPLCKRVRTDTISSPGELILQNVATNKSKVHAVRKEPGRNNAAKEAEVPSPIPKSSKQLRHIVIDGNNLATEHGKATDTFSCKGIEISIKYFLRMGHKVTAFVPNSIRYKSHCGLKISDIYRLEKLAEADHVIFTPTRRFPGGNVVACDVRRYIVELAACTDGIILSNQQFVDLREENDSFKATIENRLLMYCFVGDILMIPYDPMGRDGPFLDKFLSFPTENNS